MKHLTTVPAFHPDIAILSAEAERETLCATPTETEEETSELTDRIVAVEGVIAGTVAVTGAGLMAQLRLLKDLGENFLWCHEHIGLVEIIIEGVRRVCGG